MTKFEDNQSPHITFVEQGSKPSAPASGSRVLYFKSDHGLYTEDSGGLETSIIGGTPTLGIWGKVLLSDTLLTGTAYFDVASLSQDYIDLELVVFLRSAGAGDTDNLGVWFNNDTTNGNYKRERNLANNTSSVLDSNAQPGAWLIAADGATAGYFCFVIIYIPQYKNNHYKIFGGTSHVITGSSFVVDVESAVWINTGAINRIKLDNLGGGGFKSGSRLQIFGYKSM